MNKNKIAEHLEEEVRRYYSVTPTLRHLASVAAVIPLWNAATIRNILPEYSKYCSKTRDLRPAEKNTLKWTLSKTFDHLPLPKSIKLKLVQFIEITGSEIFEWIDSHDCICERITGSVYIPGAAANTFGMVFDFLDCLDCVVWNPIGTINYKATAKAICNKDGWTDIHKCILACNYCLEEEEERINNPFDYLMIKIQSNRLFPGDYLEIVNEFPMVAYWADQTAHVDDKTRWFENEDFYNNNDSTNECIFKALVYANDRYSDQTFDTAIQHMWNKLTDEEKIRNLPNFIRSSTSPIIYYLLSRICLKQLSINDLLLTGSSLLKVSIINYMVFECHHFLDVAKSILPWINYDGYRPLLEILTYRVASFHVNKNMLREVWQLTPDSIKREAIRDCFHFPSYLAELLDGNGSNLDIIQFLLSSANCKEKKLIMETDDVIEKCIELIKDNKHAVVDTFMSFALISEDEIKSFKVRYLQEDVFQKLFREANKPNDILDLSEVEDFIKWGCGGDNDKVQLVKMTVFRNHDFFCQNFVKLTCILLEVDKYALVDQLFNWCANDDKEKIKHLKRDFYQNYSIGPPFCIRSLIFKLVTRDNNSYLPALEKFAHWCFSSENEMYQFPQGILTYIMITDVYVKLRRKGHWLTADEILKWYCSSTGLPIEKLKTKYN